MYEVCICNTLLWEKRKNFYLKGEGILDLSIALACVGAGISLYGIFHYLNGILRHGTQPRMASWIAWLTANTVFAAVALGEGAQLAAAINAIAALSNALVIVASLSRGVGARPTDMIDWSCLVMSLVCIAICVIFPENKIMGALLAMTANVVATIPTLRHAWHKPKEETWQLFAANACAGGLSVGGIVLVGGFEFITAAGPLMTVIGNLSLVLITAGRGWLLRTEKELVEDIQLAEEILTSPRRDSEID